MTKSDFYKGQKKFAEWRKINCKDALRLSQSYDFENGVLFERWGLYRKRSQFWKLYIVQMHPDLDDRVFQLFHWE